MLSLKRLPNPEATLIKLLKYSGISIDNEIINHELEKHPYYPSMLAISDVLTEINIGNYAFTTNTEELLELATPFIIFTNINGGDFAVVKKIAGDKFYVSNEKMDNHLFVRSEFDEIFQSVVLMIEDPISMPSVANSRFIWHSIKFPLLVIVVLGIVVSELFFDTTFFSNVSWQSISLTLIKCVGLFTSILLLIQSIDNNNPLINKICRRGRKSDCNAILSSSAANVFKGLSWSEVGFFYFAGTLLLLLFGGATGKIINILAILNFFSLPYTIYSIYYQTRIAKKWCVLCCTIQGLLWLEFIPLIATFKPSLLKPNVFEWFSIIITLVLPIILWKTTKPLWVEIAELTPLKKQLRKLKYNPEIFNRLLANQQLFDSPGDSWSILLGNKLANNIITVVSNPYCRSCDKIHKTLHDLLASNNDLQARIVFTTNYVQNEPQTPVIRHLMALNELPDKTVVKEAMEAWYSQKKKNFSSWEKAYPAIVPNNIKGKLDRQFAWCGMVGIIGTPSILLNGRFLPDPYELDDIKYLLKSIDDTCTSKEACTL